MKKKIKSIYRSNFDYEEDDYDRLVNHTKRKSPYKSFTNKATMKKLEFDYEEDPFEPKK
ncbi:hypothetical protein [Anaeromicrobium sediminis]|uniref:hypothetical protein n=1 Tax=Anaeromicrobium sediminis TaxID=1478221 RepID=UPI0015961E1F|nr:hypothetical protein [Anaeromicrobium sediminis]